MKQVLFLALGICAAVFTVAWIVEVRRDRNASWPSIRDCAIGLITLFLDTLGIGAFATTTAFFKLWRLVPDEEIPGTLNVGITLPAVAEGFIYMSVVDVDIKTLTLMVAASALGAWFGAGVVARWPRRKIQIGMGITLLVTAGFLLMTLFKLLPIGGDLMGLDGYRLGVAVVANALLGALMTLGIGFFAPCMMVVYLLGMSPRAAFPIMMGSVAFLGTVGSVQFIKQKRYRWKSAIGMTLGGIPGVLLAAYLVRQLPLTPLRWLVFCVMIYTAIMMLRSALRERNAKLSSNTPPDSLQAQA
ncbi:MAG TPA: sulfite exporter TauE/SafE family protein [Acidobacteriaceae bacterium]